MNNGVHRRSFPQPATVSAGLALKSMVFVGTIRCASSHAATWRREVNSNASGTQCSVHFGD
jgi:hypothetical protein